MDTPQRQTRKPKLLVLIVFRMPVWAYRLRLGWLLGQRLLMITQLGRRTGKVRRTVVEVLRHDPVTGEFIVVAGYGRTSDWYRNIRATPALEVHVGGRRFTPTQRFLTVEEVYQELESYSGQHSLLAHKIYPVFARMIGLAYVGSEAERSTLATELPMVAFRRR